MAIKKIEILEFIEKIIRGERDFRGISLIEKGLSNNERFFELNKYLEKNKEGLRKEPINLSDSELLGFEARGIFLPYVIAERTKFNEADLSYSYLRSGKFSDSIFYKSYFYKTNLEFSILERTDFSRAKLIRTKLLMTKINKSKLYKIYLYQSDLEGAELEDTDLSEADIIESEFRSIYVKNTDFNKTNFKDTHFNWEDIILGKNLQEIRFNREIPSHYIRFFVKD